MKSWESLIYQPLPYRSHHDSRKIVGYDLRVSEMYFTKCFECWDDRWANSITSSCSGIKGPGTVLEKSKFLYSPFDHLTRLLAREYFIEFSRRSAFNIYKPLNFSVPQIRTWNFIALFPKVQVFRLSGAELMQSTSSHAVTFVSI